MTSSGYETLVHIKKIRASCLKVNICFKNRTFMTSICRNMAYIVLSMDVFYVFYICILCMHSMYVFYAFYVSNTSRQNETQRCRTETTKQWHIVITTQRDLRIKFKEQWNKQWVRTRITEKTEDMSLVTDINIIACHRYKYRLTDKSIQRNKQNKAQRKNDETQQYNNTISYSRQVHESFLPSISLDSPSQSSIFKLP